MTEEHHLEMGLAAMEKALDGRARRAAKRVGLRARKSRWRVGTVDNYGEYALTDLHTNYIVAGERFNLSADEVIALCKEEAA